MSVTYCCGLTTGGVVAIFLGVFAAIGILVTIFVCCLRRKGLLSSYSRGPGGRNSGATDYSVSSITPPSMFIMSRSGAAAYPVAMQDGYTDACTAATAEFPTADELPDV